MRNECITYPHNIVEVKKLGCSFYVATDKEGADLISIKIDKGKYKDTVIQLSDMEFSDDDENDVILNYSVIYTPTPIVMGEKFTAVITTIIQKLISYSLGQKDRV